MPSEKTLLYKKGIKLLLSRWNEDKQIDGWEVGSETYRRLSVEQKEDLLLKIAAHKFDNPKNYVLFEQEEIAAQITQFFQLASPKDGVAVLKAMEAHHGLLIERADEVWSFSHLTFQEYFTAQWINQLQVEDLASKILEHRWQGVVELATKAQQPADRLLRLIKQSIDRLISGEPILNQFLTWVLQKTSSTQTHYKPAALKAFYFALNFDLDLSFAFALSFDLNLSSVRAITPGLALDLYFARSLDLAHNLTQALDLIHDFDIAFAYVFELAHDPKLAVELAQLRVVLPSSKNWQHSQHWWQMKGQQWCKRLRRLMIEHRNTGHDWQFTEAQRQQLRRYYDANKFLVDLMNIEGAASDPVRAEIEDSLLLPWDELQRRQPDIYG